MSEFSFPDSGLIRRHDRHQFEIKLNHEFREKGRRERYRIETYFFIPNNLDVDESTYGKDEFYRDRLLYLRFKTPAFSLEDLAATSNPRSPLALIQEKLDRCLREPSQSSVDTLEYEIKLLGCTLKSALRDRLGSIIEAIPKSADKVPVSSFPERVETFVSRIRDITAAYRLHRPVMTSDRVPEKIRSAFAFTDEYMSLRIEWRCMQLIRGIESSSAREALKEPLKRIVSLVKEETDYRLWHYPASVMAETGENELFLFRMGVLKKFVSSVLYLNVRRVEEGRGLQQLALALAAGIAMLFATAVAFYYQQAYGTLSLAFFAAVVVSYMLKDRIKALTQIYLQARLSRTLFDHTTNVFHAFKGIKIGSCRESIRFLQETGVDPEVLRLRNRDHLTDIENDWRRERVLCYTREIELLNTRHSFSSSRKSGLTDIFRFNISRLLSKMDESDTVLLKLKEDRVAEIPAARVYHVNLVLKHIHKDGLRYERIRLVLTKEGIKRAEAVMTERMSLPSDSAGA